MYEAFFNLKSKPFSLLPDPEFLFLSSRHAIGLSLLEYSLTGQAGFCVITGEIGSGKTTLVRAFLERVSRDFTVGLISNTHQALRDIAAWALAAFGQKATGTHPAETYQELMAYLIAEYGAGRQCILIVDEAQNLSIEVLEELRLLSNINSGKDLLLQVVLVGQPELLDKLKRPELSQFAQRIAISHHLTPLPFSETRRYIQHRVKVAGSDRPLFTEMAMGAIQYFSGGIPRLVNSICDMALVYGFADEQHVIGEDLVFRVVSDRQLSGIAPFAHSVPVDDPSVRAEIMKLASLVAPAEAAAPMGESKERMATIERQVEPSPAVSSPTVPSPETIEAAITAPDAPQREIEPIRTQAMQIPVTAREAAPAGTREPAPITAREGAAPLPPARANPYFFRDQMDDEELLLTVEMNDSSANAHRLVPAAQRATLAVSALGDNEPHLGATWNADAGPERAPNRSRAAEESVEHTVESTPWPSINDRRLDAPIPAKEHGTGTPPRRSWWRRSIGRNS
ncbi:AAA family ATPase [Dongia sedimenti]|uniref:AAA family ATPase n=1 Tax=Dongia sedimenti TaxID=3064282 RepID=A0ABU0YR58_9PROT|nr:AAA family ATPase [Rhodospirillaceae bacterium R-7]